MSRTLRIDLLRRLLRQRRTLESVRSESGAGFEATSARTRHNDEIVVVGTAGSGPQTANSCVALAPETRAELTRLTSEGQDHFAFPAKDDVGRRFILTIAEGLPPQAAGAARRLLEEAARYQYKRRAFHDERAKAVALTAALISNNVVTLLRQAGEEDVADALSAPPMGPSPDQAAVVGALVRESYAPFLPDAPSLFAVTCADAADHDVVVPLTVREQVSHQPCPQFGVSAAFRAKEQPARRYLTDSERRRRRRIGDTPNPTLKAILNGRVAIGGDST